MSIYEIIGILRCSFRDDCGPDSETASHLYGEEAKNMYRTCFTRRHFSEGCYKHKKGLLIERDINEWL